MSWLVAGVSAGGFAAAAVLCGQVRNYALRRSLLDVPNHRSSHAAPTPRGGGLGTVLAGAGGMLVLGAAEAVDARTAIALLGAVSLVAFIGWVDDNRHVPVRWRALTHVVAAAWALYWLGGMPVLRLGSLELQLGAAGSVLALLGIVWLTNLFNFMDGIDGIAAVEAVSVGSGGALLLALSGDPGLAAVALLYAAASGGFLLWNWQPARIFMGDVGSGALGCVLGIMAVASENRGSAPLVLWVLLGGVFVVDATVTLLRRMLRGDAWLEPHRLHAYQRLVQSGWSHARTSIATAVINLILIGLAAWAMLRPEAFGVAVGLGSALLFSGYLWVELRRPMWSAAAKPE
jgi:Fuc2NAc and GlcNAc transferase